MAAATRSRGSCGWRPTPHAMFYTALDVVSGIAAGYVTHQLGPGVPRPHEVGLLFRIGTPLGHVGSVALIVCTAVLTLDLLHRNRAWAVLLLVPGAVLVHLDHIFSPRCPEGSPLGQHRAAIRRGEQPLGWLERHSGVSHDIVEQPVDIMSDGPVLVLSGDLDVRSTMQVRTAVRELLGSYDEVAIDLSGVESADVTALKVLAAATVQASATGTTSRCATVRGGAADAAHLPPRAGRPVRRPRPPGCRITHTPIR